jgi:F-type H+-transporting ATPase subunit alpha
VIYAGVNGYLDNIETSEVGRFEAGLLELIHTKETAILDSIRAEKALSETAEAALKKAVDGYAASFN